MNYVEAVSWLDGFSRFGVKLGLERITCLCKRFGKPQDSYRVIHVGGTNGKGSVCHFIGSVLRSAGYKTGVYISPHLQKFTERITIDGEEIAEDDVVALVKKLKPVVEELKKDGDSPTYFEIVTAMAFLYFKEKNVDFAVVEVGLGGRFDATNIVNPVLSIITNVSLEHQNILGNNIGDIAFEKAGIIKENIPVVTGAEGDALRVIKERAERKNSELFIVDDTWWKRLSHDITGQEFLIKGLLREYQVRTRMLGVFQGKNIAISLTCVENLQMKGFYIPDESIFHGIERMVLPGRMEILQMNPLIVADGAHNIASVKILAESLKNDFNYDKLILILGILSDKNISEMLRIILPLADVVIVTRSSNERACDPVRLKEKIEKLGFDEQIVVKDEISDAVKFAKSIAKKDDLICITGSLFTVGEAKDYFY